MVAGMYLREQPKKEAEAESRRMRSWSRGCRASRGEGKGVWKEHVINGAKCGGSEVIVWPDGSG